MESTIKRFFVQNDSKTFKMYSSFLTILTIFSIIFLVLETVAALNAYTTHFVIAEWLVVAIFTIDYLGNIIAAKKKVSYLFSFLGLADLVAILPTFLGLANLTFLKSIRVVRLLRLLRLARLGKIAKISTLGKAEIDDMKYLYKVNLEIYFISLFSVILGFGSFIHILEPDLFPNIPEGMLWSAKLVVAGVPNIAAQTLAGEILGILNRFAALILFGLLISVVGNAVRKFLFGSAKLVNEDKDLFA